MSHDLGPLLTQYCRQSLATRESIGRACIALEIAVYGGTRYAAHVSEADFANLLSFLNWVNAPFATPPEVGEPQVSLNPYNVLNAHKE